MKKKDWYPEEGDEVWTVAEDGEITSFKWDGGTDPFEMGLIGMDNFFKTKQHAWRARLLVRETLRKFKRGLRKGK